MVLEGMKNFKKLQELEKKSIGYLHKDPDYTTIYIGNLRYDKDENGVLQIFKKYGYVSYVRVNRDKKTYRSQGFAFVQMQQKEAALKAIKELDGLQFEGRTLKVSVAQESIQKKQKNRKSVRKKKQN